MVKNVELFGDFGGEPGHAGGSQLALYSPAGGRKYLNLDERHRVIAIAGRLPHSKALFVLTLVWTGARVSEVLALGPRSFQIERNIVAVATLKRRRFHVRELPVPPELVRNVDRHFRLRTMPRDRRLWPWSRTTAWRLVKQVMADAGITGMSACPRGLRHSFGVGTLQSGVPLNLVQRWLGHSRISTTAIYAAASGPEEAAFAARFWEAGLAARVRQEVLHATTQSAG